MNLWVRRLYCHRWRTLQRPASSRRKHRELEVEVKRIFMISIEVEMEAKLHKLKWTRWEVNKRQLWNRWICPIIIQRQTKILKRRTSWRSRKLQMIPRQKQTRRKKFLMQGWWIILLIIIQRLKPPTSLVSATTSVTILGFAAAETNSFPKWVKKLELVPPCFWCQLKVWPSCFWYLPSSTFHAMCFILDQVPTQQTSNLPKTYSTPSLWVILVKQLMHVTWSTGHTTKTEIT